MVSVWSVSGQELVQPAETFKTVIDLKRHLRQQHSFPVCLQQLLLAGSCLENGSLPEGPGDLQLVVLSSVSPEQMPLAAQELVEHAAETGHVEVAHALLEAGADKNSRNRSGVTALMRASLRCHDRMVRLLLDAGADANLQDMPGTTALMRASGKGAIKIVRWLLEAASNTNLQDASGTTALMRAAGRGNFAIVRSLLLAGACTSLVNTAGKTAFDFAASQGSLRIAEMLL